MTELLKPFVSLTILNPNIDKDAVTDKQSILDVRAKTGDGKQVNLEIQVSNKHDMAKRSLYYSAKIRGAIRGRQVLYDLAKSYFHQHLDLQLHSKRTLS